jgi:hypothetical protein
MCILFYTFNIQYTDVNQTDSGLLLVSIDMMDTTHSFLLLGLKLRGVDFFFLCSSKNMSVVH